MRRKSRSVPSRCDRPRRGRRPVHAAARRRVGRRSADPVPRPRAQDGRVHRLLGRRQVDLVNRFSARSASTPSAARPSDDRGRHTTSGRQLIELPGGGVLIDTPGLRELGLVDDIGGVETSFADVAAFAESCRFRDCVHESEPGCAVIAAVASGGLPAERLASYRKLLKEVAAAERKRDPFYRGAHESALERNPSRHARPHQSRSQTEALRREQAHMRTRVASGLTVLLTLSIAACGGGDPAANA